MQNHPYIKYKDPLWLICPYDLGAFYLSPGMLISFVCRCSEVQAAESSETTVNDTEMSGPPVNETEVVNALEAEMKNLKIDPNPDGLIAASEASSIDPDAQQVWSPCPGWQKRKSACYPLSTVL